MSEFYQEKDNINASRYDRYRDCRILVDNETGETLLSTRELLDIPSTPLDTYHRVKSNEVGRLDLIAAQYYRNPLLWWIIAEANGISDPLTPITVGSLIRIPTIETLYGNSGVLL